MMNKRKSHGLKGKRPNNPNGRPKTKVRTKPYYRRLPEDMHPAMDKFIDELNKSIFAEFFEKNKK